MTFGTLFKTCGHDVKNCKIKNKVDFSAYSHIYMSCVIGLLDMGGSVHWFVVFSEMMDWWWCFRFQIGHVLFAVSYNSLTGGLVVL